jgi:hypothetical protein
VAQQFTLGVISWLQLKLGGDCCFTSTVEATMDGMVRKLSINSEFSAIQKMDEHPPKVEPYSEISLKRAMLKILAAG